MNLNCSPRLPSQCFFSDCPSHSLGPNPRRLLRKGFYFRSSDSKLIARFLCRHCRRSFSQARFCPEFRQKKRRLNEPLRKLLVSQVSQRRCASLLNTTRKTVVRKFLFLSQQAKLRHQEEVLSRLSSVGSAQFDEMESFERSKCLPLSIPLIVESQTRLILGLKVCSMPAKGPLAEISRRKYGPRADDRKEAAVSLWRELVANLSPGFQVTSDQKPAYRAWIREAMPPTHQGFEHVRVKGRRGCVVGQGELKRGGWDPLFSLNHTAAMIRANVNRMARRTWCTTKRRDRLEAHLMLYLEEHNRQIRRQLRLQSQKKLMQRLGMKAA